MLLSKTVHCLAIAFKMTEQVEKRICIKFCGKLEHSSTETVWIIQKAVAMGNWWMAQFFGKTSNHPGYSDSLQARFGALLLLDFPKTKITFEREEILDCWWDSEKYDGAAAGDSQNCVRSQIAYFEGDLGMSGLCTMSVVSCIFFNKCLYFS